MRKRWFFIAPAAIVGIVLFSLIGGELVMRLWNWLLPPLFGWRQIGFWQALGLLALCRILFGGFGRHGIGRHGGSNFRRRMRERWEHMTPEEREKFRSGMRGRCRPAATGTASAPQAQS
jgi:hypothetical protein